jgi:hypothetical protein
MMNWLLLLAPLAIGLEHVAPERHLLVLRRVPVEVRTRRIGLIQYQMPRRGLATICWEKCSVAHPIHAAIGSMARPGVRCYSAINVSQGSNS